MTSIASGSLLAIVALVAAAPVLIIGSWLVLMYLRRGAYYRYKQIEAPPLPMRSFVRYGLLEGVAMLTLIWWRARAALADGRRDPRGPVTGPPVLCVHGITQNGSNLWGIRRALARRGRSTRAVSLGLFGRPLVAYVPPLERAFRELVAHAPDGRVDVVAHSMGGVVLRMMLAQHPDLAPHLRRVVTLGSPHAGTASGRGFPLGGAIRNLGRRSSLLSELPGFPLSAALTTIAARHDLIVYPQETCHLPGARVIDFADVGHVGLLTRRVAIERVVDIVCEPEEGGEGSSSSPSS
ncbi:MAG: alpha/beta fold hydrolase [Pseudomonadota bacterium]|nr:alpha/beta fold hydrolase [Pseudomonadota bacterium]